MARLQEWAVPSPDLDLQVTAGEQFQPPGLYLHAAGLPSAAQQEAEPLITQYGCRRSPAPSFPPPPSLSYTPSWSRWLCEPRRSAQSEQKRGGVADSIGGCRPPADRLRLLKVSLHDTVCSARRWNYLGTDPAWVCLCSGTA